MPNTVCLLFMTSSAETYLGQHQLVRLMFSLVRLRHAVWVEGYEYYIICSACPDHLCARKLFPRATTRG